MNDHKNSIDYRSSGRQGMRGAIRNGNGHPHHLVFIYLHHQHIYVCRNSSKRSITSQYSFSYIAISIQLIFACIESDRNRDLREMVQPSEMMISFSK